MSYKSVIWTYVAFRTCLHSGSWAPSCFYEYDDWLPAFPELALPQLTADELMAWQNEAPPIANDYGVSLDLQKAFDRADWKLAIRLLK